MFTVRNIFAPTLVAAAMAMQASASLAADAITMQMNWTADTAHLGFAMAQYEGIYAAHDLDVTMVEGRGSAVAAQLVAAGNVDIGYADTGAILGVASKGAPIKIISTVWKSGQFGIQFLTESGISGPQDLVGKKLAVSPGSAMMALMPVFLKANNLSDSDVEIVNAAAEAFLGLLTSGQVDAVVQTPENVVVPLAAQGIDASNMYFYDNGVPIASLSLVARDDMLADNPEVYRRFVAATAEGWKMAMENPEAAVDHLLALFPDTENTKDALLQSAVFSFASACPGGTGDTIGATSAETWDEMYAVMTTAMDLPSDKPVTTYYTNDYVPAEPVLCP